ncbi:hypothetical protein ACP70R_002700 [Stipagrostis hirtigluma subsp. patula]
MTTTMLALLPPPPNKDSVPQQEENGCVYCLQLLKDCDIASASQAHSPSVATTVTVEDDSEKVTASGEADGTETPATDNNFARDDVEEQDWVMVLIDEQEQVNISNLSM